MYYRLTFAGGGCRCMCATSPASAVAAAIPLGGTRFLHLVTCTQEGLWIAQIRERIGGSARTVEQCLVTQLTHADPPPLVARRVQIQGRAPQGNET